MEQNSTDFENLVRACAAYYLLDMYDITPAKAREIIDNCAHIETVKVSEICEKSLRATVKKAMIEFVYTLDLGRAKP